MLHKLNHAVHFTVYEKDSAKPNSSFQKLCGIEACLIALGICDVQIIFLLYPSPSITTTKKFKDE